MGESALELFYRRIFFESLLSLLQVHMTDKELIKNLEWIANKNKDGFTWYDLQKRFKYTNEQTSQTQSVLRPNKFGVKNLS